IESDTNATGSSTCNTIPGGITVDQDTGTIYALWLSGNDVQSNLGTGCNYSQIGPFDKAWVSVSSDGGANWTSHLAWQGNFNATSLNGDNADKIFSTITVDSVHQVHIALSVRHNDDPVGFTTQCAVNNGNCSTGGGICTFGLFCAAVPGSNRGLADVFEVHVDPAGGANVTWTKDLNGKFIQFACQNSGSSAFAGAPDLNGCYGPADMSITKSDSPDPVGPGQNLTYHLTVTNKGASSGPSTTSGVTVTDPLPAGVTLV